MKQKFLILIIPLLVLVLSACTNNSVSQNVGNNSSDINTEQDAVVPIESKAITLDDVATHNTPDDCWTAIDGKAYDISEYIKLGLHPNNKDRKTCGLDGSIMFSEVEDHDEKGREALVNYEIGLLKQ